MFPNYHLKYLIDIFCAFYIKGLNVCQHYEIIILGTLLTGLQTSFSKYLNLSGFPVPFLGEDISSLTKSKNQKI